jgi:erythronate-4-phosphate dehydrogenase
VYKRQAGYSLDGKVRGTEMVYRACCEFLQTESRWQSPLAPPEHLPNTAADRRRDILHAYNIREDDRRMAVLLHDKGLDAAHYFDHLRKSYPVRREFSGLV